jgi:O-antigen/teichoic acid export membrane protein
VIIGIAFNFFFFAFALPISYVLFGTKFLTSGVILQYSILFLTFNYLFQINFNILAWVGRVWERAKIIAIALVINIITNIIFINLMRVAGAAVATGLWWIIIWLMSEYVIKWEYTISIKWREIFINILILWSLSLLFLWYFWDYAELINYFTRIEWFFIMLMTSIIYFCVFVWINYRSFRNFIWEIKKIRKW